MLTFQSCHMAATGSACLMKVQKAFAWCFTDWPGLSLSRVGGVVSYRLIGLAKFMARRTAKHTGEGA